MYWRKACTRQRIILIVFLITAFSTAWSQTPKEEKLEISGLIESLEIYKDVWGISHIFAQNQKDLFFAQGFNVARDRLFQLEIWRRQATGTLAEIQGEKALKRDIGARLLKARVDMKEEMNHYHPQGEEIITSFVKGINAYIDLTRKKPELLPLEFRLLNIKPLYWTPEVVVSRHNGLFRNARYEIEFSQAVSLLGPEKTRSFLNLSPGNPELIPKKGLDISQITPSILEFYTASRAYVRFGPEDVKGSISESKFPESLEPNTLIPLSEYAALNDNLGSNNWVVSGRHTFTGYPYMANDPHRHQQIPSLRYWVHLHAPGWNVIGGGEPCLPGVSIGHNEHGAWGLTIFAVDQEDLYVYDTHPKNPNQYRYQDGWEDMKIIPEIIPVKGQNPAKVELKYTRHGPVLFEDKTNHKAYALRAAWLEIGCAPYLASLRMDQAKTWEEFREACSYSRTPSENMIWADIQGNIGWQSVGIAPIRHDWDGLLPVPGDGRFEWEGYLPIRTLPHVFNPPEGFFSTANENNIPPGYPHKLGFIWTEPFRQSRIQEVLGSGRKFTLSDMVELQKDVLSIPARTLIPLLKGLGSQDEKVQTALERLQNWDYHMTVESIAAAIYHSWQDRLVQNMKELIIPSGVRRFFSRYSLGSTISLLMSPDGRFGTHPTQARDKFLLKSLAEGVANLEKRLGSDMNRWQYGQKDYHYIHIRHMMSEAVIQDLRPKLDVGPAPRPGNRATVNQTTNSYNQTSGASFRIIADLSDWDKSLGSNTPGQSGDPNNPHYRDLFLLWAQDKYFPVFFTRSKIESVTESLTTISPKKY